MKILLRRWKLDRDFYFLPIKPTRVALVVFEKNAEINILKTTIEMNVNCQKINNNAAEAFA